MYECKDIPKQNIPSMLLPHPTMRTADMEATIFTNDITYCPEVMPVGYRAISSILSFSSVPFPYLIFASCRCYEIKYGESFKSIDRDPPGTYLA